MSEKLSGMDACLRKRAETDIRHALDAIRATSKHEMAKLGLAEADHWTLLRSLCGSSDVSADMEVFTARRHAILAKELLERIDTMHYELAELASYRGEAT